MRRIAALAAFTMVGFAGVAEAERLAMPAITAPAELADEAGAVGLLVRSSLAKGKLTIVDAGADRTVTATLSRAGTGLELDVAIASRAGGRETAEIVAGDGDVVALATGMLDKISAITETTQVPVRAFALGQLRPFAAAARAAKADPAAAIAILADASPAVALGLPAVQLALVDLIAAAPTPTARLAVARAIGATEVVTTLGAGKDGIAAAARAFAAIDRADLATAETELANVGGGLAALGHAAVAAAHDDVRLGGLLQDALQSDQRRAALALASTIVPAHLTPGVHRALLPLAEAAARTSPGVAARIGFGAAQSKVEPARALALISVRELDQFALDALGPILDAAPKDVPRPTVLRLRAELAMRTGDARRGAAIDAYLAAAPADPRAQAYARWETLAPRHAAGSSTGAPTGAPDDDFVHHVNEPRSSAVDLVLPIVAGVGVLVLATLVLLRRRKRAAPTVSPVRTPPPRRVPEPMRPAQKLKIDMTTPPIAPAPPPEPTQAEVAARLQATIDVELPAAAAAPVAATPISRPRAPAAPVASVATLAAFADANPLAEAAPAPRRSRTPSVSADSPLAAFDVDLGAPDLMPLGSDPKLQFPGGSTPSHDIADFALDAPGPRVELDHPNLVKPGARPEGKPLAALLAERGALPWLEAVGLADQICAGLAHAHAGGVVHGGVQPATIYVAGRVARLGDFHVVNKPPYAPPDRAGAPADDLYAIGATLAEMLGPGEAPPKLAALVAALRAPRAERPASIADVRAAFKALFDF